MNVIKVMLCDDIESIRYFFRKTINAQEDIKVIHEASTGKEALSLLTDCASLPDIILMDIQMEDEKSGINATREIHERFPHIKILMLTIHEDDDLLIEAYLAGAVDYIVKNVRPEVICATLRNAYNSENFIGTVIREKTREILNKNKMIEIRMLFFINKLSKLTNSEWRILRQLYEGKKRREIAEKEVLSEGTVKLHIRHILRKLEFPSTKEMVTCLKKIKLSDYWRTEDPNASEKNEDEEK